MNIEQPYIYHKSVTTTAAAYADYIALANKQWDKDSQELSTDLSLGNGQSWTFITKSRYSTKLLWDEVVAPKFGEDLICFTWGRPFDPSLCDRSPKVENIVFATADGKTWKST